MCCVMNVFDNSFMEMKGREGKGMLRDRNYKQKEGV